ncbi:menaquinone biosynthesis protein [Methylacidiphilum caldifontis]|uniref:menaquinone biosynthesis protein n=1 Tax=Methylacidiphilum caldifontis TaxID=2795386 RepID=UPI001A8EB0D3|nr:menaquinone biosynthesis protein [Methylacidiphilum caldifontis]QSR89529.1 menaquinone biosynthesis protein [Methylacidiphilum caldifontis]
MHNPRIGCVPYLNAKPLIYGIEKQVIYGSPVELSIMLKNGQLDVALCPVGASLVEGWNCFIDGIGIVANGDVYSVIFVLKKPLELVQTVNADPQSRSSVLLLQVILESFYGKKVQFVSSVEQADGFLLIGDKALEYRKKHPGQEVVDLGGLWKKLTGLPFVFALWTLGPAGMSIKEEIKSLLTKTKERGLSSREKIAANSHQLHYLTHYIHYEVGEKEKMGIEEFLKNLIKINVVDQYNPFYWV